MACGADTREFAASRRGLHFVWMPSRSRLVAKGRAIGQAWLPAVADGSLIASTPSAASCRDGSGCPNSRSRVPRWSPSAKDCIHCQSKTESSNLGKSRQGRLGIHLAERAMPACRNQLEVRT